MRRRPAAEIALALSVGVVLADSSIVTLALPEILDRFETSVFGVSWVLTAFNIVLALLVIPFAILARRAPREVWGAGLVVFAVASAVCALAPSFAALLGARLVQALGGAALVAGAIELLARSRGSHSAAAPVWGAAGLAGLALGPAIGGLLTELLSWESIFFVQVPLVGLIALVGSMRVAELERGPAGRLRVAPEIALGLLSAGLTGALFLLVILLTEGWGQTPLTAALVISVMPLATLAAGRIPPSRVGPTGRVAGGAILLAAGLAGLGLLPGASIGWVLAPQILIGAGIALSLPGLTSWALTTRDPTGSRAAVTIAARHAGVVLGIVCLTPIFSAQLTDQYEDAERSGTAFVLDAQLSPETKIALGDAIAGQVAEADGGLPNLGPAFDSVDPVPEGQPAFDQLRVDLADELDRAATNAFSLAFLIAAAIALAALAPIAARRASPDEEPAPRGEPRSAR